MRKITSDIFALCKLPMEDFKKFINWVWKLRSKNRFDANVLRYPRVCMVRVQADGDTVMMVPLHPVLMFESLAPDPSLGNAQKAMCLYKIGEKIKEVMKDSGHCEAYFLTTDDRMAEVVANHGWTEQKGFRVMKLQIEPPDYPIQNPSSEAV